MKLKFTSLITLLVLLAATAHASQTRKVLVIGIDGTRSDALQQANTPNLDALIATGFYTYDAWHLGITVSGPSWSTIMTGTWWNKHGVSSNAYTGSHFDQYPYFPTRAKELKPNLQCVQVTEWAPMSDNVYNDGWNNKLITPDGDAATTGSVAAQQLADPNLDVLFVYFDQVDLTGHSSGFSPSNPSYIQAIENVDLNVGVVIDALHNRANYANEDWLILITTDHGGIGTGHGGITWEERHIWWIASGTNVAHQQVTAGDPGTYNLLGTGIFNSGGVNENVMKTSPVQADIAVTALHHLIYDTGINPEDQAAWNMDGKSWLLNFSGTEDVSSDNSLTVYPNPVTDVVTFWMQNDAKKPITYSIYDFSGRLVKHEENVAVVNKLNIDLSALTTGIYMAEIEVDGKKLVKKLTVN